MAAMTFDKFYEVIRLILGDEQVHGIWYYPDARVDSAVKSVFLLNRGPSGFELSEDQTGIEPEVKPGDAYAIIAYEASSLLIGGDVGAIRMHTREGSISDEGHRKRDLLIELAQQIYEIRDGGAVFSTSQSFDQFVHSLRSDMAWPLATAPVDVVTQVPGISV